MMYLRNASLHNHIKIEILFNHFLKHGFNHGFSNLEAIRSSLHPLPNISLSMVFLAST